MRSIVARPTLPFYDLADALNRGSGMNVFAQPTPDDGHLRRVVNQKHYARFRRLHILVTYGIPPIFWSLPR